MYNMISMVLLGFIKQLLLIRELQFVLWAEDQKEEKEG